MKNTLAFLLTVVIAMGFVKMKTDATKRSISPVIASMRMDASNRHATDTAEPWTAKQLLAPAALAMVLNNPDAKKPFIYCVGPGALIKGSIDTGPAQEHKNLEKLKVQLARLTKDADIVIYCGCCPFEHCPNIRPAFILLNEMKFTNAHLLNLEHNIRTDWVAKGYPQ